MLTTWWLITSWRARQLSSASLEQLDHNSIIAAAACVRPLVETAAATAADGRRIASAWDEVKRAGRPRESHEYLDRRQIIIKPLHEILHGAKFVEKRAPRMADIYGANQRTNVLGAIDKLGKKWPTILEDYEWLCNIVHPSVGNLMAFADDVLAPDDELLTHIVFPVSADSPPITGDLGTHPDLTVRIAISRAAVTALKSLRATMDDLLQTIDDVGLTTGATSISTTDYWRRVLPAERNQLCPCRSGKKSKECRHDWENSES